MKVGIIAGSFDVMHPGYIYMFIEACQACDKLVVALHTDPSIERPEKIPPILSVSDRHLMLTNLKGVDTIIEYAYEHQLESIIRDVKPQIRFLGDDYKNRIDYTGYGLCPEVYYFDRSHGWSATKFKTLIYNQMKETK